MIKSMGSIGVWQWLAAAIGSNFEPRSWRWSGLGPGLGRAKARSDRKFYDRREAMAHGLERDLLRARIAFAARR